ncbi:JAB domain-containing protein [Phocaeicola coprocola]|uniref:JAB domain-containing protein n=1 Tax=Phocaeicola coprocola TaxID=310298 RepID=UPI00195918E7|nr:JAB domain-containing protein [Phocaeicola coprocola]MBM6714749.1 JAB domain-containing protein [Phocaeicola coprocola]
METKNFEICSEFRTMDMAELAYILTNRESVSMMVKEEEVVYGNTCTLRDIIADMTPARRRVALAAIEFHRRGQALFAKSPTITSSNDIFKLMSPVLTDLEVEEAWVLFLNPANKLIRKQRISIGGLSATQVDVRVILKEALLCNAVAFCLIHNHPSGNIHPSASDDRLTRMVFEAGNTLNIKLLDHVIVGNDKYFSYADEGRI